MVGDAATRLLEHAVAAVAEGPWTDQLLHLRRGDEVLLDAVVGGPADRRVLVYSATKGVVNAAFATLVDDGDVEVEAPVTDVLPWFTGDGKQDVTIEHVLLHTAGMPAAPMRPDEGADPARRRERMQRWRTMHAPGAESRYHPTAAHWVLQAIAEEVTGTPLPELVRQRLLEPLGLGATSLGADADADPRIHLPHAVGEETPDEVLAALRAQGMDLAATLGEAATRYLLRLGRPEFFRAGVPAAGLVTQAREVAEVYAALASGRPRLWSDEVRHAFTTQVRSTLPSAIIGGPSNRSLGMMVSGDDGLAPMRGMPSTLGPRVFGQWGSGGNVAWADPDTGLVLCAFTSSVHRDPLQWYARMTALNDLAAAAA